MKQNILKHACRYDDPEHPGLPVFTQAGAICWRGNVNAREILLITSLRTKRRIIPKGWSEPGMTLRDTARQETWEEAGIADGILSSGPVGSYLYDKLAKNGGIRLCRVHVFSYEVHQMRHEFPEAGRRSQIWLPPGEAAIHVREPALQSLLLQF